MRSHDRAGRADCTRPASSIFSIEVLTDGADVGHEEEKVDAIPAPLPPEQQKLCEAFVALRRAEQDKAKESSTSLAREVLGAVIRLLTIPDDRGGPGLKVLRDCARATIRLGPIREERTREVIRLRAKMVERLAEGKRRWEDMSADQRESAHKRLAEAFLADVFRRNDEGPIAKALREAKPIAHLLSSYGRYLKDPDDPEHLAPDQENVAYREVTEVLGSAFADVLSTSSTDAAEVSETAEQLVKTGIKVLGYPTDPFEAVKKARARVKTKATARAKRLAGE